MAAGGGEGVKLLSLTTALGGTALLPVAFHAEEAISQPFSVRIEMVSQEADIDPDRVLHKPACLTVHRQHAGDRHFHGVVRSFAGSGTPQRGWWSYTAEVVPRFWFLNQTVDCRIFQGKTVQDILDDIVGEVRQTIQFKITGAKKAHEYVTQYNERDFDFALRLLEAEGWHFHFEHSSSDHVMVVGNQNQGFPASPKPTLHVVHEGGNVDVLTQWRRGRSTAIGKVRLLDYDPAQPSTKPSGQQSTTLATEGKALRDVFQWPALHLQAADVSARARVMMEAGEASVSLREAAGQNHLFTAGSRFVLARDPFDRAENVEHIIQRVSHYGRDDSWITGGGSDEYSNQISAFPAKVPWRQPLATPRPVMAGVYGAIVLGPKGEEIHSDELGRIKVQLFFDHRQETSADKAVWARVMQPWAGNTWGWQHLPRVGTEVAVGFMDGDPDRPVVLGGLYNGEMKPVFPIPGEQTKSGLRTRSTKQGDRSTFSELSFDDKKGNELVFLHAQKDMTVEVEHDQKVTIDNDRTHTVTKKDTTEVGDGQTNTIKNSRSTTISSGDDKLVVSQGDLKVNVEAGAVTIEAMTSITLKVGQSTVKLDQQGVSIKGLMISVEGQTKTDVKAPMTQVSGDATLTLKGGIMMVN